MRWHADYCRVPRVAARVAAAARGHLWRGFGYRKYIYVIFKSWLLEQTEFEMMQSLVTVRLKLKLK